MSLTFQQEPFWQAYEDAKPLLSRHFDEIAGNKALLGAPDPALDKYRLLNDLGRLHALTVRDGSKLVGYFILISDHAMHYQSVRIGLEDLYYLAPEYRGRPGFKLIVEAEKMMRESGAQLGLMKTKEAHNKGPVLERLGWRPFERVYCKVMR